MVENDLFTNGTADHHGEHHGTTAFGEHHDGGNTHGSEPGHEDGTDSHEETTQERNTIMKSNTSQTLTGLTLALMFIIGVGCGSGALGFTPKTGGQSGAYAFITSTGEIGTAGLGFNPNDSGGGVVGAATAQVGGQLGVGGLTGIGYGTGLADVTGGANGDVFTQSGGGYGAGSFDGGSGTNGSSPIGDDSIAGGGLSGGDFGNGTAGDEFGGGTSIDGGFTVGNLYGGQF